MNGKSTISGREPESIYCTFYQQHVRIALDQSKQPSRRVSVGSRQAGSRDGGLTLAILRSSGSEETRLSWRDEDAKIETRVTEIAIELILTAEIQHREQAVRQYHWRVRRKGELEEEERQRKLAAERAEIQRQKALEQARIDRLLRDAEMFQQANEIRNYVEAIRLAHLSNGASTVEELEKWSKWALAQADRIDPAIRERFLAAMQDKDDV
jgi:hypothetical protein